ncbi:MAG: hypothetical protein AB1349_09935, partial [Elusimicrobiota bacterium]
KTQIKTLISSRTITGKFLSIDATPLIANVKENNPKVFVEGKFNKNKFPKNGPDARLSVMIVQNAPKKPKKKEQKLKQLELLQTSNSNKSKDKQTQFYWGYKNYTIFDSLSELPVFEITKSATGGLNVKCLFLVSNNYSITSNSTRKVYLVMLFTILNIPANLSEKN